jgi:hypothetical protein
MADAVKITGLTKFSKGIKEIDDSLPKTLRLALNGVADVVIVAARAKMPSRTGKAKSSIKATSGQDRVKVRAGGRKAPHYPWLDYGGEGRIRGRPTPRPFIKGGRYLYPVYFAKRDSGEFLELMTTALLDVVRAAGIEVD